MNDKPARVQKAYERNDLVPELTAQIRKSKALDWLVHHVEIVDPDGDPIDRDLVLGHTHGPDGEHLHDHDQPESSDSSSGEPVASSEASGGSPSEEEASS